MTPLHFACVCGKLEIVELLLNDTQNVNQLKINTKAIQSGTKYYVAPLHIACQNRFTDIVKILLSNIRTDYNVKTIPLNNDDDKDIMPLHYACENGSSEILKLFLSKPNIGVDAKASMKGDIFNSLHLASLNGHVKVVALLLKNSKGLKMLNSQSNIKKYTALHLSCMYSKFEVVDYLIKQPNINLNILDGDLYTPLHLACMKASKEVVDIMVHHPQSRINFAQILYDLEGICLYLLIMFLIYFFF